MFLKLVLFIILIKLNLIFNFVHINIISHNKSINYFYEKNIDLETYKYIEIENGSNIHLRCIGDKEIKWLFDRKEIENELSYNSVITTEMLDNKTFISDLKINQTEYDQTGEYSCFLTEEINYEAKNINDFLVFYSDRIYVFVNDIEHLIAKKTLFQVPTKSEEYILNCLPTNPRVKVTLIKDTELLEIDNDTLKFHPTIGFIIKDEILDYKKSNLFNCLFSYNNITEELAFPFTISYVPVDNLSIKITGDSENVVVNSYFTLTCELLTQKVGQMKLFWTYPNSEYVNVVKNNSFEYIHDQMKYIYNITILNVTKSNEGEYSCSASNTTTKNTKLLDIKVFDLNTTFSIEITTDLGPDAYLDVIENINVVMAFNIAVWPTKGDFELFCKKNNFSIAKTLSSNHNYEIENLIDDRFDFKFENNQQFIIDIKNVSVNDSGIYTLYGKNSNSYANESIVLIVKGLPSVSVNYENGFFELNKFYNLNFEIISFDTINITFKRILCSNIDCDTKNEKKWLNLLKNDFYENFNFSLLTKQQTYSKFENDYNLSVKSFIKPNYYLIELNFTANFSSIYKCEIFNEYGITNQQLPVLISESGVDGLNLNFENEEFVENDNITLICKASKFNYLEVSWSWLPNKITENINSDFDNGLKIIDVKETNLSIISKLKILNSKIEYSGVYKCEAKLKNGLKFLNVPIEKTIKVNIEKMVPPKIIKTNIKNKLEIIEVLQTTSIDLYCEFEGKPNPKIIWKKNGIILNHSSLNGIELNNFKQHLSIRRLVNEDSGRYECNVYNKGGLEKRSIVLKVKSKHEKIINTAGLSIFTFILVGSVFVFMAIFLGKRIREDRKQKHELEIFSQKFFNNQNISFNPDLPFDEQIDLLSYDPKWEFPIEKIKFGSVLGQGAFGLVVKAEIEADHLKEKQTVAVKMLKENADMEQRKSLMAELKILIHLGKHLNVVNLIGAITTNILKGELFVILEYCEFGSLRQFLLNNRNNFINQLNSDTDEIDTSIVKQPDYANDEVLNLSLENYKNDCYLELNTSEIKAKACLKEKNLYLKALTTTNLICYAYQVSRGMEYLSSKKLIHRDLASRNILLAENDIIKICDFGLAKDCILNDNYIKKGNGLLPIKWMAVESIADRIFTVKSDVWSFGVLLWEIFTLGGNPFPAMQIDEEFLKKLKNGFRLEKPEFCPKSFYLLMNKCWFDNPDDRPDFKILSNEISDYLEKNSSINYINLNLPYQKFDQIMCLENESYLQMNSENLKKNDDVSEDYLIID